MKYLILCCLFFCSTMVVAQTNSYDLDKELEKVYLKYQMEDGQKSQVKTLLTQKYKDLLQIRDMSIPGKEKNRKKMELIETYDEAFIGLLSDKQKQLHQMYQQLGQSRVIQSSGNSMPGNIKGAPESKPKKAVKANQ
ncbi:MAG: hypothetical protein HKN67_01470 [Saprospiraceae bacterium]|nr:hypothetical protein [Bacteroidia bacterium]NNF20582.1 hypothetical protein [Saprospiraceae bacterium]